MSFQAYLDNIQTKTGKTPADFRSLAASKGYADARGLRPGIKAGDIIAWLNRTSRSATDTRWQSWRC